MNLHSVYITALIGILSISVYSQQDSINNINEGLRNETMLHPSDAFTGYVLQRAEFIYNQTLTPYPSWAWWGITNRITTELDFECWLGGVPSFNFRFGIVQQQNFRPSISFETMFQYLKKEIDQFEDLSYLGIIRKGKNWYNHVNLSWKTGNNLHMHLSFGATNIDNIIFTNKDTINPHSATFNHYVSPDFSLGIDYRFRTWISFHSTASYGSTFVYADNIIRKRQVCLGTRIVPFIKSRIGFFNAFRLELTFLHADFMGVKESITGPIGFVYWQSRIERKKEGSATLQR